MTNQPERKETPRKIETRGRKRGRSGKNFCVWRRPPRSSLTLPRPLAATNRDVKSRNVSAILVMIYGHFKRLRVDCYRLFGIWHTIGTTREGKRD